MPRKTKIKTKFGKSLWFYVEHNYSRLTRRMTQTPPTEASGWRVVLWCREGDKQWRPGEEYVPPDAEKKRNEELRKTLPKSKRKRKSKSKRKVKTMKFEAKKGDFEGAPAGVYQNAVFCGCVDWEPPEGVERLYDGETVELRFKILGGEHDQTMSTRLIGKRFGKKAGLRKFAQSIAGDAIEDGQEFDFDDHIGAKGTLVIEDHNERTRPASFVRDKSQPLDKDAADVPF